MRGAILGLVASAFLYAGQAVAFDLFPTESAAQRHCPTDVVVWLNTPTMIWHYKGQRWYGNTKQGSYTCKLEAAAAGARGTRNGQ